MYLILNAIIKIFSVGTDSHKSTTPSQNNVIFSLKTSAAQKRAAKIVRPQIIDTIRHESTWNAESRVIDVLTPRPTSISDSPSISSARFFSGKNVACSVVAVRREWRRTRALSFYTEKRNKSVNRLYYCFFFSSYKCTGFRRVIYFSRVLNCLRVFFFNFYFRTWLWCFIAKRKL